MSAAPEGWPAATPNADLILKTCEIPAVPMVAMKIIRLVDDPKAEIDDLHEAIMADQSLAARVLKMANSSYYGTRRDVDTVSAAIMMMGFGTIKNLAVAVSTREVYKKFGLIEQKLWEHSIGVSVAASLVAREVRFFHPEAATVAGLLHDVGKVIMNNSHPERFAMLTEAVYNDHVAFSDREKEHFGFGHAEAGGVFAQKWGFPDSLSDPIRRHHFGTADDLADLDPNGRALCRIIALADALCMRLGVGYRGPVTDRPLRDAEFSRALGLTDDRVAGIIEAFKTAYVQEKMSYMI